MEQTDGFAFVPLRAVFSGRHSLGYRTGPLSPSLHSKKKRDEPSTTKEAYSPMGPHRSLANIVCVNSARTEHHQIWGLVFCCNLQNVGTDLCSLS